MGNKYSEIVPDKGNIIINRIIGVAFVVLAVILYLNNAGIGWAIGSLVIGIGLMTFGSLVSKANCPNCGHKILKVQELEGYFECPKCESYLLKRKDTKRIELVDEDYIATEHVFKWVLPWNGFALPGVTEAYGVIGGFMLKTEGAKELEARWPQGCCICGSTTEHQENISKKFRVTPGNKAGMRSPVSKDISVFVNSIPHCSHHSGGAVLKVAKNAYGEENGFLAFRSLKYYQMFKQLNKQ